MENGFLGYDLSARTATIWDDGNSVFSLTNAEQLGQSVVAVLDRPEKTANKNIYVASVETSQNDILAALEKVTGSKWTVNKTTNEKEINASLEKLGKGDFSGAFGLVRATSYGNTQGLRANYVKDEELANELLGLKLESVEDTVRRVVKSG